MDLAQASVPLAEEAEGSGIAISEDTSPLKERTTYLRSSSEDMTHSLISWTTMHSSEAAEWVKPRSHKKVDLEEWRREAEEEEEALIHLEMTSSEASVVSEDLETEPARALSNFLARLEEVSEVAQAPLFLKRQS